MRDSGRALQEWLDGTGPATCNAGPPPEWKIPEARYSAPAPPSAPRPTPPPEPAVTLRPPEGVAFRKVMLRFTDPLARVTVHGVLAETAEAEDWKTLSSELAQLRDRGYGEERVARCLRAAWLSWNAGEIQSPVAWLRAAVMAGGWKALPTGPAERAGDDDAEADAPAS